MLVYISNVIIFINILCFSCHSINYFLIMSSGVEKGVNEILIVAWSIV